MKKFLLTAISTVVALTLAGVNHTAAASDCESVAGTLTVDTFDGSTIEGTLTGSLEGQIVTVLDEETLTIPGEGQFEPTVYFGASAITTEAGDLMTEDVVAVLPLGFGGMNLWLGSHVIVGGTGDFENAAGALRTFGMFSSNGGAPIALQYNGVICDTGDGGR